MRTITACAFTYLLLAVQGCATTDAGWQGNGATPFGSAESLCAEEAKSQDDAARDTVFEACMARHGWTRGADD